MILKIIVFTIKSLGRAERHQDHLLKSKKSLQLKNLLILRRFFSTRETTDGLLCGANFNLLNFLNSDLRNGQGQDTVFETGNGLLRNGTSWQDDTAAK